MKTVSKRYRVNSVLLRCLFVGGMLLVAQVTKPATNQSVSHRNLLNLDLNATHLGGGVSVSPDGQLVAYVGNDDALHLLSIGTGEDRVFVKEVGPGLDVFDNPAFSADGTRILVAASGGTRYYPSNIYSVTVADASVSQVTTSTELPSDDNFSFSQYFYSAQESRDGASLLLRVYDAVSQQDKVGVLNVSTSQIAYPVVGRPIGWSRNGKEFFYVQNAIIRRFNIVTNQDKIIDHVEGNILGKADDDDSLLLGNGVAVKVESTDGPARSSDDVNLPMEVLLPALDGKSTNDGALLRSVAGNRSGRLVLDYRGESAEQIQIIDVSK